MDTWLGAFPRVCWGCLVKQAARSYVVGPQLGDGVLACRRLRQRGFAGALGFSNGRQDTPRHVADQYGAAAEALAREHMDCLLRVKLSALAFSRELLGEVLERSRRTNVGIDFDAPHLTMADRTFSQITWAVSRRGDLGCTLPGRWRRSLRDADLAVDLGLNVRVAVGDDADDDGHGADPREGFLSVVDRLVGRARHVAVATHDAALAKEALRRLRRAGTRCELDLRYGLPLHESLEVAIDLHAPVRMHIPYGHPWLPYQLASAGEDPSVLWWFVRDLFVNRSASWAGQRFPNIAPASESL